jgi:hypothetical protein
MKINKKGSPHVGPPGSTHIPEKYISTVKAALKILERDVKNDKRCNSSFRRLKGGRDFNALFNDSSIWLNYDSDNSSTWGWVIPETHPKDIIICQVALRMGKWSTAATIVHEVAHLNGAPGGDSHSAEIRVKKCSLDSARGPYDPHIKG